MSFIDFLNPVLNPTLGPLMSIPNPWNLLFLSLLITLVMTLLYKFLTDQKLMKELKDEMKKLKDNPEKMMEVQKKAMEKNMKYLFQSLKPTLITFIPILIIFEWIRQYYLGIGSPDVLFGLSWIWIYILASILFSLGLRKLLKVY